MDVEHMPGKIRTLNPQIRSLILYPIEPQAPPVIDHPVYHPTPMAIILESD